MKTVRVMQDVPAEKVHPLLAHFGSYAAIARAVGKTPQAIYVRIDRDRPLVTGSEAIRLYVEQGVQLCVSRPELVDFRIRKA